MTKKNAYVFKVRLSQDVISILKDDPSLYIKTVQVPLSGGKDKLWEVHDTKGRLNYSVSTGPDASRLPEEGDKVAPLLPGRMIKYFTHYILSPEGEKFVQAIAVIDLM